MCTRHKKTILKYMLAMAAVLLMLLPGGLRAKAETTEDGMFDYKVIYGGVTITAYHGKDNIVRIPETVGKRYVIGISEKAFSGNSEIEEVVLPDYLVEIGKRAFYNCKNLRTVQLPGKLWRVGVLVWIYEEAFRGCTQLTDVLNTESVFYVDCWAFEETPWLAVQQKERDFVILGSSLLRCGKSINDRDLRIPEGVELIAEGALAGARAISIWFPQSVKYVGYKAFKYCDNVELIQFMNPDCCIIGTMSTLDFPGDRQVTIKSYSGGYVERTTAVSGLTFVSLGEKTASAFSNGAAALIGGGCAAAGLAAGTVIGFLAGKRKKKEKAA